jgi:hypothetical protein
MIVPTSAIYVPNYLQEVHDLQMLFVQFVYNVVRLVPLNVRNMQTMPLVVRLVPKHVESVQKPVKCRK